MMSVRASVAAFALAICACSAAPPVALPSPSPANACQTAGLKEARSLDPSARLAAAFESDVADVASWESQGYGTGFIRLDTSPSSYPGPPLDRVDVCYYDGAFRVGGHPFVPAGGASSPPFDQLLVTVNSAGHASLRTAGFRQTTPLASPPHGP